ncbi:MAG: hypothetical protein ACFFE2_15810 [Candidatus Thorarchaeota archaeon]
MSEDDISRPLVPTSGVSFDDQVRIIRAYVVLSENGKNPVHYKDVMRITRLGRTQISGVNSFMVMLGLLVNTSRGNYSPTEAAIDFSNCDPGDENFTQIASILEKSLLFRNVNRYLRIHGGGMSQGLVEFIMEEAGTKEESRVSSALEWFSRSGLIQPFLEEESD